MARCAQRPGETAKRTRRGAGVRHGVVRSGAAGRARPVLRCGRGSTGRARPGAPVESAKRTRRATRRNARSAVLRNLELAVTRNMGNLDRSGRAFRRVSPDRAELAWHSGAPLNLGGLKGRRSPARGETPGLKAIPILRGLKGRREPTRPASLSGRNEFGWRDGLVAVDPGFHPGLGSCDPSGRQDRVGHPGTRLHKKGRRESTKRTQARVTRPQGIRADRRGAQACETNPTSRRMVRTARPRQPDSQLKPVCPICETNPGRSVSSRNPWRHRRREVNERLPFRDPGRSDKPRGLVSFPRRGAFL